MTTALHYCSRQLRNSRTTRRTTAQHRARVQRQERRARTSTPNCQRPITLPNGHTIPCRSKHWRTCPPCAAHNANRDIDVALAGLPNDPTRILAFTISAPYFDTPDEAAQWNTVAKGIIDNAIRTIRRHYGTEVSIAKTREYHLDGGAHYHAVAVSPEPWTEEDAQHIVSIISRTKTHDAFSNLVHAPRHTRDAVSLFDTIEEAHKWVRYMHKHVRYSAADVVLPEIAREVSDACMDTFSLPPKASYRLGVGCRTVTRSRNWPVTRAQVCAVRRARYLRQVAERPPHPLPA